MTISIRCNIITVTACLVSVIIPIINMIRFSGALMKRLKKIMPCYDNDREFISLVKGYSADDDRVVRERRNYFRKILGINFAVNFICLIAGVAACCLDGIPIKGNFVLAIVYFVSAGVFAAINIVCYLALIKKFKLSLKSLREPKGRSFRFREGPKNDIVFDAVSITCLAAIFVGGSFVTTTHVIMTWLGI